MLQRLIFLRNLTGGQTLALQLSCTCLPFDVPFVAIFFFQKKKIRRFFLPTLGVAASIFGMTAAIIDLVQFSGRF